MNIQGDVYYLEYADEIGDFGWLKYYSSEYKRGYRLSRKVYIK